MAVKELELPYEDSLGPLTGSRAPQLECVSVIFSVALSQIPHLGYTSALQNNWWHSHHCSGGERKVCCRPGLSISS